MEKTPHSGKVAIVTGAGGGLGRVIAESLLAAGASVVICDINKDMIADFTRKVSSTYPETTLALECNITDDAALDELFLAAEKRFGKIDYLVNNAGMMDPFDPVGDVSRDLWDRVIALNLTAPAMAMQRAVESMLKNQVKGSIVNVASIAGYRGFTAGAAYTASKHGLLGLTKNTAAFYGSKGIRCNAIVPGGMHTNIASAFANGMNMDGYGRMRQSYPEDAFVLVSVDKVAHMVLYLCSDVADVVNGAAWTADGGVTAG